MSSDCADIRGKQITYSIFNIFIWPSAAHLSFYYGLYGILQEPGKSAPRRMQFYKYSQTFLCFLWFIFTIISSGSQNGWAKLGVLSGCETENNTFGFAKFLTIVEIFMYYISCGLGLFSMWTMNKNLEVVLDPFEETAVNQ